MELISAFKNKKILITGGLGFIGSNLAHRLTAWGAEVTLVDVLDPKSGANLFNISGIRRQVHLELANIGDEEKMRAIVRGQDFLFNLAGRVSHIESMRNPLLDLEANATSQIKLLETCRLVNPEIRIVFAGPRQVYGRPKHLPVNEEHLPAPVDYNGVSKSAGERYHIVCHQVYGVWTSVLRMTNVYGPRMYVKDDTLAFIGNWFRQIMNGDELSVFGDGQQIRDLSYVDYVVDALLACVTNPLAQGQIYNLGGEAVSLKELARLIVEVNKGGSYRLVPFPPERKRIDIGYYIGDYDKIHAQLGWEPKVSLRDGLERTLAFYREYGEHYW